MSEPTPFSPVVALACDLAMCWLEDARPSEGFLLLASAPIYVREMQARWPAELTIAAEDQALEQGAARWAAVAETARRGSAVWSVPQRVSAEQRLELLDAAGVESLVVFGPGPLAKLVGPRRPGWLRGQRVSHVLPKLSSLGYRAPRRCSIGDKMALLWAGLARAAGRAGLPHLRDRCEAAFRLRLTVPLPARPGLLDVCMVSRG